MSAPADRSAGASASAQDAGGGAGGGAGADPGAAPRGSRRSFLDWALGGALAAWGGAIVYPVVRYLTPEQEALTADEVVLADGEVKRIERDGFAIVRVGNDRAIVFRAGDGALHALDARCSHESCTVQYKGDEDCIWCACHNARFDIAGRVLSGPPPRPLAPFVVKEAAVGGASQVTVLKG